MNLVPFPNSNRVKDIILRGMHQVMVNAMTHYAESIPEHLAGRGWVTELKLHLSNAVELIKSHADELQE